LPLKVGVEQVANVHQLAAQLRHRLGLV
jgi:hypothetical protein